LAGMKSYGRAPTFLMATGYEQVRSIAAALAGDTAAAHAVELQLPETGVCSTAIPGAGDETAESSCDMPEPALISLGLPTGLRHGRAAESVRT
jgi:hypothetical protein